MIDNDESTFLNNMAHYYNIISQVIVKDNEQHNDKLDDYWNIFLSRVVKNPEKYKNKTALDFGSGGGRNVINLLKTADFKRVDGVDISEKNVEGSKTNILKHFSKEKFHTFVNSGDNIPAFDKEYDLVTSFAVLQHIPSYKTRFNIFKDIYRVLKDNGELFLHMISDGFDGEEIIKHSFKTVGYFSEELTQTTFNGLCDATVENTKYIQNDLTNVGFKNIEIDIRKAPDNDFHKWWIYIKAEK